MTNAVLQMWGEAECRTAHEASLAVLADPGVEVQHARARQLLEKAGAAVDGTRVAIPAELVAQALSTAPRSFAVPSRGGHEPLVMVQGNTYFGTGGDCLYTVDPHTGERRRAELGDIESLAVLSERLDAIDFVMSMGLPADDDDPAAELAVFAALLRGTRKPLLVDPVCDAAGIATHQRMAAIAGASGSFMIYAMSNPPLVHSEGALDRLMACAELGIPVVYSAGACAGFTCPASRIGQVVNNTAEGLSGLVVHQLAAPGAPFIFGVLGPAMSMRTSSFIYASPDGYAMQQAMCDLTAFYGLPSFAMGGCSDGKAFDAQWGAETAATIAVAGLGSATLVHDVGYLESSLLSSHEAVLLGAEMAGYVRAVARGVSVDDVDTALAEIRAVGPGGAHLGRPHTRAHARTCWSPTLLDQWGYDHWLASGSLDLKARATAKVLELDALPRPFELEADVSDALDDVVVGASAG